jgi:hypothetical protein
MRKSSIISCIVAIAIIATITVTALDASPGLWFQASENTDKYVFPQYTGEAPLTYLQIIDYLQIPEDELVAMSTDGLIETCLDYPIYSMGMISSNESVYSGFQKTKKAFNGLQELLNRSDTGNKLVNLYQGIDLTDVVTTSSSFIFRLRYIEYIIAENEVLTSMNPETRGLLQNMCKEMIIAKFSDYPEIFSIDSTLLIALRIEYIDNSSFAEYAETHESVKQFLEFGTLAMISEEELQEVISLLNINFED